MSSFYNILGIATVLFIVFLQTAKAQYRLPVYTDYLTDNYYILHPAMAGAHFEGMKLRSSYRTQWLETPNAPSMQSLNAHARVGERSGVGGMFFHDKNGFQSQLGFQATYAHHIPFTTSRTDINQLSFGLSGGGSFYRHDRSSFDSTNDIIVQGTNQNSSSFFVDAGISYNYFNLYAHLTVRNLVFVGKQLSDEVILDKPKRVLASAGAFVEMSDRWALEPSFLVDLVQYVNRPNVDISLKSHHDLRSSQLWGGLSFRKGLTNTLTEYNTVPYAEPYSQVSIITGIRQNKWMFSYTYTLGLGDKTINSSGFHQFTLGIDILSNEFRPTFIRGIL